MLRLVCVTLCLLSVECLLAGDSCFVDEHLGTCRLLSECEPLMTEIKSAGTPMPARIRAKLQPMTCGYQRYEPIVCCVASNKDDDGTGPSQNVSSMSHANTSDGWNDAEKPLQTDDIINPQLTNAELNQYPSDDANSSQINGGNDVDKEPPDVRVHSNLRLLPSECGAISESYRIFGGTATALNEMPWMVLIAYNSARGYELGCGGSLINERYVLTAAHCVAFLGKRTPIAIVLGEYDTRKDPECERVDGDLDCYSIRNVTIDSMIAHPGYTPESLLDDIALIRLSTPADFTSKNMKPLCLPTTPELRAESLVGAQGIVAGWGTTETGLQSPVLLRVELPILSNTDCQKDYNGLSHIHDGQVCAGGSEDKDSCAGDSGGPLMYPGKIGTDGVRYVLRGIVSYGSKRCGVSGFPGVYTRVAYYMDWILDHIHT